MAAGKSLAAAHGGWIVFEDEAGFSMTPPRARTWGRRGHTARHPGPRQIPSPRWPGLPERHLRPDDEAAMPWITRWGSECIRVPMEHRDEAGSSLVAGARLLC